MKPAQIPPHFEGQVDRGVDRGVEREIERAMGARTALARIRGWIALVSLGASACSITPVVGEMPIPSGDRYNQCRLAASDYCKDVKGAEDEELDRCISRATYECVAGGPPSS
jgi:hypothetical protein